jgi:hypothetical protein
VRIFLVLLGVAASLATVVTGVVAGATFFTGGSPKPVPSASGPSLSSPSGNAGSAGAQPSNPQSATGLPSPTLTYPPDHLGVSRSQGFVASGAAPSALWPDSIWILDHGTEYIVDRDATVNAGRWSALDRPLGNSSNSLPYDITMVAVLANPACASRLSELDQSVSGDHIQQLPTGCTQFGQVTVHVDRP